MVLKIVKILHIITKMWLINWNGSKLILKTMKLYFVANKKEVEF